MPEKYKCMPLQTIWCETCKRLQDCKEIKRSLYECPEGHKFIQGSNLVIEVSDLAYIPDDYETWWEEEYRQNKELEDMRQEFKEASERVEKIQEEEDEKMAREESVHDQDIVLPRQGDEEVPR